MWYNRIQQKGIAVILTPDRMEVSDMDFNLIFELIILIIVYEIVKTIKK